MLKVILTRGAPGAGKSFWAKQEHDKDPEHWKLISRDDLRRTLDNCAFSNNYSREHEEFVVSIEKHIVSQALKKGFNIIIHDTNVNSRFYKDICSMVEKLNIDCEVSEKCFYIPFDEAVERDSKRQGVAKVGPDVIKFFWDRFGGEKFKECKERVAVFHKKENINKPFVPANQNENAEKAIISDIDGTLAIIGNRSPYNAENCDVLDSPNYSVIETVKLFYKEGYKIIFCSGREDKYEESTRNFIGKYLPDLEYKLFMRKTGDFRKDATVKEEIYKENIENNYNVLLVLDDRGQVVSKWRELGLTCFQVAQGDF